MKFNVKLNAISLYDEDGITSGPFMIVDTPAFILRIFQDTLEDHLSPYCSPIKKDTLRHINRS